jgi:uncharacterized membrane protein
MIAPPLTVERLLEGLSARSSFRDGILGDLAEEFAERAESDGVTSARRWYNREALRAAPHLLLDWARSLRLRDARRLMNVLVASYFLTTTLFAVIVMMVQSSLETLGISTGLLAGSPQRASHATELALGVVAATLAGYCAASLDKRTPLASSILLGVLWSSVGTAMMVILHTGQSLWYFLAAAIVMVVGTTAGGMLQIRNARFDNREEYLEWREKHAAS